MYSYTIYYYNKFYSKLYIVNEFTILLPQDKHC